MAGTLNEWAYKSISYSGADYSFVVHLPGVDEYLAAISQQIREKANAIQAHNKQKERVLRGDYIREFGQPGVIYNDWEDISFRGPEPTAEILDQQISGLDQEIAHLQAELKHLSGLSANYLELKDLQTMSISLYREKSPVRTFGSAQPRAYTRGPRTIAGSMIFTVFDRHAFHMLAKFQEGLKNTGVRQGKEYPNDLGVTLDQLAPFDIFVVATNEFGTQSVAALYGVEILNDGTTMSIQDMLTEQVVQYVARDWEPLQPRTEVSNRGSVSEKPLTVDDLMNLNETIRKRRRGRFNPFI